MGLLDALLSNNTDGGGLLSLLQGITQPNPQDQSSPLDTAQWPAGPVGAPSQAPASFADRFNALPNAPPIFNPAPRTLDGSNFDPSTYAPNQAGPISVGSNYQMPRIGDAGQFQPSQAALPPNAQPTQGQLPSGQAAPQPAPDQALPPALGGNSFGGNLGASLQSFAGTPGGLVNKLLGGTSALFTGQRTDPQGIQQQNLKAQFEATRQSLIANGESPASASSKAMLAVMNPEAGKTILSEALTNKEQYKQTGEDAFGNKSFGFVNERDQTINGKSIGEGGAGESGTSGMLAPGVKQIDSSLTGKDYLEQFSPEVKAAVQNYVDGKSMPTGNPRKGFTQAVKMIAQKYGADTNQSVDDATYTARRTMRNQLSSSAPSSLGGQINIGNTAAGHLADLSQKATELGNIDTGIAPLTAMVNGVRGLGTEQAAKMEALKGAAQHYGQEITKFYAGSPGGTAERDRFIESVNGARSPKELAAILSTEGELMHSRLDALGGQIQGVLGDEGLKQYPVLRPDGAAALAKVNENVSKLRGGSQAAAPTIQEGATATNPKTGAKITFLNGKWQ